MHPNDRAPIRPLKGILPEASSSTAVVRSPTQPRRPSQCLPKRHFPSPHPPSQS
ncbi:hypothetical protein BKA56DRAFT_606270 [Ilyonectria sp. MPI-CAGE-AT-0026]|nr:hypothetical protein BKA56DRAFT_606270 [Ilyonectria sp. MPI-CAGE-AT-0026]